VNSSITNPTNIVHTCPKLFILAALMSDDKSIPVSSSALVLTFAISNSDGA